MSPVSFSQNKAAPADGGLVQGIPFKMFLFYEELYVGLPLKILFEHLNITEMYMKFTRWALPAVSGVIGLFRLYKWVFLGLFHILPYL